MQVLLIDFFSHYGLKMFLRLPECYCSVSGKEIPGNLPPEQVPQMIMISFDDAVNTNIYEEIELFLSPTNTTTTAWFRY